MDPRPGPDPLGGRRRLHIARSEAAWMRHALRGRRAGTFFALFLAAVFFAPAGSVFLAGVFFAVFLAAVFGVRGARRGNPRCYPHTGARLGMPRTGQACGDQG